MCTHTCVSVGRQGNPYPGGTCGLSGEEHARPTHAQPSPSEAAEVGVSRGLAVEVPGVSEGEEGVGDVMGTRGPARSHCST